MEPSWLTRGRYFYDAIELPSTFEQLRTTAAGNCIRVLVDHLNDTCTNPAIVNALLCVARPFLCEIVADRTLTEL